MSAKHTYFFQTVLVVGLILIIGGLVSYKRIYRKQVITTQQYKQNEELFKNNRIFEQQKLEEERVQDQKKKDSMQQIQLNERDAKLKKFQEIRKAVQKEIEDKKE